MEKQRIFDDLRDWHQTQGSTMPKTGDPNPNLAQGAADVQHLLNAVLHCCDISNPAKPWATSEKWADMIALEYEEQGEKEQAHGLILSPFMDKHPSNQAAMSLNFIDFIVAPMVLKLTLGLPNLEPLARNVICNRGIWHDRLTALGVTPPPPAADLGRVERFQTTFVDPLEAEARFWPQPTAHPSKGLSKSGSYTNISALLEPRLSKGGSYTNIRALLDEPLPITAPLPALDRPSTAPRNIEAPRASKSDRRRSMGDIL